MTGPPSLPAAASRAGRVGQREVPPPSTRASTLWNWRQLRQRLNPQIEKSDIVSCLISFGFHLVLLLLLAIPVLHTLQSEDTFTTLIQSQQGDDVILFDAPINTELSLPENETSGSETAHLAILDDAFDNPELFRQVAPSATTDLDGDEGVDGNDEAPLPGLRIADPENSVRAGSFTVWPWPIRSQLAGYVQTRELKDVLHEEPGSFPKLDQDYHIVIRIRIPDGKKTVSPRDFSGEVVGTDGYQQKIPDRAEFYNAQGQLTPARSGRRIPVVDGTAELLIRVPAAGYPNVKDTIRVRSQMLNEEQTIELVFEARRIPESPPPESQ